jgi:hypothetical protein
MQSLKAWGSAHFLYAHNYRLAGNFVEESLCLEKGLIAIDKQLSMIDLEDGTNKEDILEDLLPQKKLYESRLGDVKQLLQEKQKRLKKIPDREILFHDANGAITQRIVIEGYMENVSLVGMDNIKIRLLSVTKGMYMQDHLLAKFSGSIIKNCCLLFGVPGNYHQSF